MSRSAIASADAPKALGPYSQAQLVQSGPNRVVYTSGQVGLDPKSGVLADGITAQTKQVLANLDAVLSAAGCTLGDVVKTTVFLADMADFEAMNKVYGTAFARALAGAQHGGGEGAAEGRARRDRGDRDPRGALRSKRGSAWDLVVPGDFKSFGRSRIAAEVGSIPTRSRHSSPPPSWR